MKLRLMMSVAGAGGLAGGAPAQQASDVAAFSISETGVLGAACFRAFGEDCGRASLAGLVERIDRGDVKLVVVEIYYDLPREEKEVLLPALERHLARGGRLLLSYTNLDEWPELQELVGVRTTGDVTWIRDRQIWSVEPAHPTWWGGGGHIGGIEDFWPDNGDFLDVGASGYVLATWDVPGGPSAMTLTRSGRIMTYGFDLDGFEQSGISRTVANQLVWLLNCQADIDGDGELTFFDFLAFQNLFAAGDLAADFAFDGVLDFFDFIEFQNQFIDGCP